MPATNSPRMIAVTVLSPDNLAADGQFKLRDRVLTDIEHACEAVGEVTSSGASFGLVPLQDKLDRTAFVAVVTKVAEDRGVQIAYRFMDDHSTLCPGADYSAKSILYTTVG